MSDIEDAAASQIRSLVERIEHREGEIAADQPGRCIEHLRDPHARLVYAADRIEQCAGHSTRMMNRAYRFAAKLMGQPFAVGRDIVHQARFGRFLEHRVGPLDGALIGFVYRGVIRGDEGLFKIGFTRDLEQRAKRLSSECGRPVDLRPVLIGTVLDELSLQCALRDRLVAGEWFRAGRLA